MFGTGSLRALRVLLLAGVVAALAGCAAGPTMILPPLDDTAMTETPGTGIVVVQVMDTTPLGQSFPVTQLTLASRDMNSEEDAQNPRLIAREDLPGDSARFFFAELPADEYAFTSLRSYHQLGDAWISQFYPAGIELGTFRVEAGSITDLGVVAVYIDRSGEDYRFASARIPPSERSRDLLRERFPALAGRIDNLDSPLGWTPDGADSERDARYREAVQRQIVFGLPLIDEAAGRVHYPAHLGVIVTRDEDRNWRYEGFQSDEKLVRMSELPASHGAVQLLVTEFDEIFVRADEYSAWEAVPSPSTEVDEDLLYVDAHPAIGLYGVTRSPTTLRLWTSDGLGEPWRVRHAFEPQMGFFEALNNMGMNTELKGGVVVASADNLVIAIRNSLFRFDFDADAFIDTEVRNPESVAMRNGAITVRTGGFIKPGYEVSRDGGLTWSHFRGRLRDGGAADALLSRNRRQGQPPPTVKLIGHPIFLDETVAFAVHQPPRDGEQGVLLRSDDAGETWEQAGELLPEGCFGLTLATERELLLHCFLSGEFYRSDDAGANWVLERAVSET